jgi:hypothetical protein
MAGDSSLRNVQQVLTTGAVLAEPGSRKKERRMKTSRQLGWRSCTVRAAAVAALSLALVLAPRPARAQATCVGDCGGDGSVTVDEIIIMVNIALGSAQPSACPDGIPSGATVDITLIIQAVNNALGMCSAGGAVCGNGVVETGEDCDEGGTCTGGTNAGTHCTAESDCQGNGICVGGTKDFNACADDAGCPGGKCVHCKTFGSATCAANCTTPTEVVMTLKPGEIQNDALVPGTSGAVIHGQVIRLINLPLTGVQTVTIGKKGSDGLVPAFIRADSIQFPRIPVTTIACACLRGVAAKTCGGTLYDIDGVTPSADCTDGFTAGASVCTGKPPCSFLHGPDNAASGTLGCGAEYAPVDMLYDQDLGGASFMPKDPIITLSGSGPTGSGLILSNSAIGTVNGLCSGNTPAYGPDGEFCTDDDPQEPDNPQNPRGQPSPQVLVTGMATGQLENGNGVDGQNIGPFSASGTPVSCDALLNNQSVSGAGLAAAFVSVDQPGTGDIVVTTQLVGQ